MDEPRAIMSTLGRHLRRWGTHALRALRAIALAPPFAGALVVLGLAAWPMESERTPMTSASAIAIAATAIAIGLCVGLVAELLVRLRYTAVQLARRGAARTFGENAVACFGIHAALVLWSMADSPQLYAARWYASGGLARTIQVLATDVLAPSGVVLLAGAGAVAYARPRRLVVLLRRAGGALGAVRRLASSRLASRIAWLGMAAGGAAAVLANAEASANAEADASASASGSGSGSASASGSGSGSADGGGGGVRAKRPNILLIAASSLRADRIDSRVAPTLSALAGRGARFDRAYATVSRTRPAWMTMLTGQDPHHHGIRSSLPSSEAAAGAAALDTLPERLARAGYATRAVSDYAGDGVGGFDLGALPIAPVAPVAPLTPLDAPSLELSELLRARALTRETALLPLLHSQLGRRLFPVMRTRRGAADPMLLAEDAVGALHAMKGAPFFLTVFFSTASAPHAAPAPYYAKYTDSAYRGRYKYGKPVGREHEAPPDAADVKQIRALYDGSVSAIDAAVARVLRSLEREGLADDTIVVVTADHGETLFEQGRGLGHGDHLFGDEGTHVPLLIYDPRAGRSAHVERVVRDVDLAPTLYELTGVAPPADLDGRSLAPALEGGELSPRFAYAETGLWLDDEIAGLPRELRIPYPGLAMLTERETQDRGLVLRREMVAVTRVAKHRMIRDERWKLVYAPARKGVRCMLFDTLVDPAESHDLAADKPDQLARLKSELWRWMLRDPLMEQRDGFLVPRVAVRRP